MLFEHRLIHHFRDTNKLTHFTVMKTEDKVLLYRCQVCDRHFSSRNSLKVHLDSHNKLHKYKCKHCGVSFRTQGSYYMHIRRHNGNSIICHYCGKIFYHNDKFKCHLRIHTGEKPFICKHCPRKFASRDNLKRHDVLVHKNDNDFSCSICTEKFVFYQNFLDHLKCHKVKKYLKCDICKKAVKSKSLLLRHMRVHTGKKPYKCEMCSASFSDSSNKKRHMKIHEHREETNAEKVKKTTQIISSQNQDKDPPSLSFNIRNSKMKIFILINESRVNVPTKSSPSSYDHLFESVKPGRFTEDGVNAARLQVSSLE